MCLIVPHAVVFLSTPKLLQSSKTPTYLVGDGGSHIHAYLQAIDLIDEAGSRVRLRHAQLPEEARDVDKQLRALLKEKEGAVRYFLRILWQLDLHPSGFIFSI